MNTNPYYAVIFISIRTEGDKGYSQMAERMFQLASNQDGFLGMDSAKESIGITISYWKDLESIQNWKNNPEHLKAQELGKSTWYKSFKVRITKVEREYEF